MTRPRCLTAAVLLCLAAVLAVGQADAAPVKRILIVGDSWAASIATQAVGYPGFGSFDAALNTNGIGAYSTQGALTAWPGRKASDWVEPQNLAKITQELQTYPTIDIVHLIIGGNDFLNLVAKGVSIASFTPEQRSAFWDAIEADIQTIVDHCLAQRPDIRVLISDYDYLDAAKAEAAYGFNFGGATPRQLNDAFVELGRRKLAVAQRTPRCAYVSNWGVLQHFYDYPAAGLPLPGAAPAYDPYSGGDPDATMPPTASVGDGIHPTDQAHRYMLQRCIDQYYFTWLTTSGAQPGTAELPLAPGTLAALGVLLALAATGHLIRGRLA